MTASKIPENLVAGTLTADHAKFKQRSDKDIDLVVGVAVGIGMAICMGGVMGLAY